MIFTLQFNQKQPSIHQLKQQTILNTILTITS